VVGENKKDRREAASSAVMVTVKCCKTVISCTQARKNTHGINGQHHTWTGLPVEESIGMTEDRDKWRKYVHGVANHRIEVG